MNEKPTNPNDIVGTTVQKNKNTLFKGLDVLRSILFIPICFLFIRVVYQLFIQIGNLFFIEILNWSIFSEDLWPVILWPIFIIVFIVTFSSFIMLSAVIMMILCKISPHIKFRFWTVTILSILSGLRVLYLAWFAYVGAGYFTTDSFKELIVFSLLVFFLTISFIWGAFLLDDPDND